MEQLLAQWQLPAVLQSAPNARQHLSEFFAENMPDIDPGDYLLAITELIVNLCRYPDPKPTQVQVAIKQSEYFLNLELLDNGGSFRSFTHFVSDFDPLLAGESGMGLKLLRDKFDDVFYIPACYREDALNLTLVRKALSDAEPKETILLVDDDLVYRKLIALYLQDEFEVIEAGSVGEAYDALLRHNPSLVICDIQMPEADGPALFDQIRQTPKAAKIAFIFLTGLTDKSLLANALSRPIDELLHKPIAKEKLLEMVRQTLQRRHYLADQVERELYQKASLGLTPRLPKKIGPYDCVVRHHAPHAGGGDFVLLNKDDSASTFQVVFADLMGHDLMAKSYVFALAGYLRGLCSVLSQEIRPAENLLELIAKGFETDQVLEETLATLMVINLDQDGLNIANAGQPKPLLIQADAVSQIDAEGALPGLGYQLYQSTQVNLQQGERLLIYSDGLIDSVDSLPEALETCLLAGSQVSLNILADNLMEFFINKSKLDKQKDDCTLILLELGEPNDDLALDDLLAGLDDEE